MMTDEIHPFAELTDAGLEALLKRAIRIAVIVGLLAALALWIGSGWRNAAMMATGAAISAASIHEWRRLARFIAAKMDKKETSGGSGFAVVFFVLRLTIFAGVIYVSLKFLRGSAVVLLCGLSLAVLAIGWEAIRLLRD
jgi:hypothetical protein